MKINAKFLGIILITLAIGLMITGATACSSKSSSTNTSTSTSTSTSTTSNSITISLTAQNTAFDKNTITVPAGAAVTINFDNKDTGISHNFALYQTGSNSGSATGTIFQGKLITGPQTTVYTFTAPATAGTYFFRCDVHPTMMTGSFIVQ